MCGLKPHLVGATLQAVGVTPFVGVWIEPQTDSLGILEFQVTPFVGVWIETYKH